MKQVGIIAVLVVLAMIVGVRLFVAGDAGDGDEAVIDGRPTTARDHATAPLGGGGMARRPPLQREPPPGREAEPPPVPDGDGGNARASGGSAAVVGGGGGESGTHLGQSGSARSGASGSAGDVAERGAPAPGASDSPQSAGSESAEAAPRSSPAPGATPENAPVLLSMPLKDGVDSAQGDNPTKAEGVVIGDDGVEFTADAQFTVPAGGHIDGREGSVDFEVEPRWAGSDETNNSLLQIRDPDNVANALQIVKNLDTLRFVIVDATGVQNDVVIDIADWQANQPRRVTATWSDAMMVLYIDGEPVGQTPLTNGPKFKTTTPIHVGSDFPGSQFGSANGRISNLTIYGRPLQPADLK